MKKLNFSRVIIALAVMLTGILPSFAHDFEVDGIYYNVVYSSGEDGSDITLAEVTYSSSRKNKYTGNIVVPETVVYGEYSIPVISIGYRAFYNCTGLTSVTIPNSVTTIGSSAFYKCTGLTSVTIPNSVTTIGDYAFENCSGLAEVTIPNSVISIGEKAFYKCTGLTSVTIPNSVTSIGNYAFENCTGLTSVAIPNSVTTIGDYAFDYCSGLTSIVVDSGNSTYDSRDNCNAIIETVTNTIIFGCKNTIIPNSVTEIGSSAFSGRSGLTSITIPNSVTSIGGGAFSGCSGLTSITIPNSVTSIGNYAFSGCSGLTSITIPNSVTSIGIGAFYECDGLTSVTISTSVTSIEGITFYYCTGLTSVTIPNSVTSIGMSAFNGCKGLKEVTIPNSVTSIGSFAFSDCKGLKEVTIPNSVTEIGNDAFSGCSGLTEVNYNAENCTTMGYPVFRGCNSLKTINIGNSVKTIPSYAFSGCSFLRSVTIGNSVISIGDYAFYYCFSLKSVTIPNSVTSIGNSAFAECSVLTSVTIGNSVTSIGDDAFSGCSGLTSITIPESVTSIGHGTFDDCNNLLYMTLLGETPPAMPSGFISDRKDFIIVVPTGCVDIYKNDPNWSQFTEIYEIENKYLHFTQTSNNKCYLSSCEKTASGKIEIPKIVIIDGIFCEVTSIEEYAFFNCTGLTSVTIPNSVTSIGNYAFNLCTNLAEVIIEDGKETLSLGYNFYNHNYYSEGRGLFYDCPLEKIYLGRNLDYDPSMYFGYSPFYNKSKIKEITIGNSVTKIGNKAFDLCINLKLVINLSNLYFIKGTQGFGYIAYYANRVINAPNGYIDGDFIWAEKDNVNKLLAYIGNATEVTIPNSVTTIGYDAFSNCTRLTEVNISDLSAWYKIDFANEYANPLYYAGHLKLNGTEITNLVIPDDIYQIKRHTFVGCTGLTSVTIPNSVTSIGAGAFSGSGLRLIFSYCITPPACGDGAFYGCYDARLMVPEGTYYDYLVANEWYKFDKIQEFAGIEGVEVDNNAVEIARYDIYGRQLTEPTKGVNIIKMSDGSTRKEYVK